MVFTLQVQLRWGKRLWEKWQPSSRKLSREQSTVEAAILKNKRVTEWAWAWFGSFSLVRSIHDLRCHKFCVQWVLRALLEDHKAQGMFYMGSSSLPRDATCKHRVETSLLPVVEKIQDGHICWQSDVYSVLGPQGCTVGGYHGKEHNSQCCVKLCSPVNVMSSH